MRSPLLTQGRGKSNRRLPSNKRKDTAPAAPRRSLHLGRRILPALKGLAVLALVAGLGVGLWALRRHVLNAEYFAVKRIAVRGASTLGEDAVAKAAGVRLGMNIFSIRPADAAKRLAGHPWVAEARVSRRLPSDVDIEVRERKAWALASLEGLYLVDQDGEIFKRWEEGDPFLPPILTGITRDWLVASKDEVRTRIQEALDVYREYSRLGLAAGHPLSEIHLAPDGDVTFVTLDPAESFHLGRAPFEGKLQKLAAVLDDLHGRSLSAEAVFLDQEVRKDRVTVRLAANPG